MPLLAPALVIIGLAHVVDGDTLRINNERIRLYGIDAPEKKQTCLLGDQPKPCGLESKAYMETLAEGKMVRCIPKRRDRYQRLVAICYHGTTDLSATMVRQGQALAYRQYSVAYTPEEKAAKAEKLGMWQGQFEAPWAWRQTRH